MAKEIPYFKFYPNDWINGDITLEDYSMQGLFINICAYYWSKECDLSITNTKKRFRGFEDKIDELISTKILKTKGENVLISFLDEQLSSKELQNLVNKINGRKGGRPKKVKTEEKPNGFLNKTELITETKPIDDEKDKDIENKTNVELPSETLKLELFEEAKPNPKRHDLFVQYFNEQKGIYTGTKGRYTATTKVTQAFALRIKKYDSEKLKLTIRNAFKDKRHIENNFQYVTPEFVLREEIIERYINIIEVKEENLFQPA